MILQKLQVWVKLNVVKMEEVGVTTFMNMNKLLNILDHIKTMVVECYLMDLKHMVIMLQHVAQPVINSNILLCKIMDGAVVEMILQKLQVWVKLNVVKPEGVGVITYMKISNLINLLMLLLPLLNLLKLIKLMFMLKLDLIKIIVVECYLMDLKHMVIQLIHVQ
jgi:hypothetical protein